MSSPPTLHPDLGHSTLTMQSPPDTPADAGLDEKAVGRSRDALEEAEEEAEEEEEEEDEEDGLQLPSVELIERYMERLHLLGAAQDVEAERDEMKQMASNC